MKIYIHKKISSLSKRELIKIIKKQERVDWLNSLAFFILGICVASIVGAIIFP